MLEIRSFFSKNDLSLAHENRIVKDYLYNNVIVADAYNLVLKSYSEDRIPTVDVDLGTLSLAQRWRMLLDDRDKLPLTKDFLNPDELQRVRDIGNINSADIIKFGIRIARGLKRIRLFLDIENDIYLLPLFSGSENYAEVMRRLKLLGDFMKKFGSDLTSKWFHYVNLETAFGYKTVMSDKDAVQGIVDWVAGDVEHSVPIDQDNSPFLFDLWFIEGLRSVFHGLSLDKVIDNEPKEYESNNIPNSFDIQTEADLDYPSFVYGGMWARKGSTSYDVKQYAMIKDKKIKLSKTKNTLFVYSNPDMLIRDSLKDNLSQSGKAIMKRERGKVRYVCGMDQETYLLMSYVDNFVDGLLRGCKKSSLWMGSYNKLCYDISRLKDTAEASSWNVPLDQSQFDHVVSRNMLIMTLGVIEEELYIRGLLTRDVGIAMSLIIKRLTNPDYMGYVNIVGQNVKIEHGVLSGWKWTALIDTLINIAELYVAQKTVSTFTGEKVYIEYNAQGDDDDIKMYNLEHAVMLCHTYKYLGLLINPAKFFIRRDRNEYLRKVQYNGVQTGYPGRMVLTFNEINPIREHQVSQLAELASLCKNWVDFAKRANPEESSINRMDYNILKQCISDICINLQISQKVNKLLIGSPIIRNILHTGNIVYKNKYSKFPAIVMPSGLGKTTLKLTYPDMFYDVDDILLSTWDYWKRLITREDWDLLNKYHRNMLRERGFLNKVLLCHSPSQLPESYEVVAILNSLTLNIREKTALGTDDFDIDTLRISLMNRLHLYRDYKDHKKYIHINSNKQLFNVVTDLFCDCMCIDIAKTDYNALVTNRELFKRMIRTDSSLGFNRIILKYDKTKFYNVTWSVYRFVLGADLNLSKQLNIDAAGISSNDVLLNVVLEDQKRRLLQQVYVSMAKLRDGVISSRRGIGRISLLINWLYTPAYLGGRGLLGFTKGSKHDLPVGVTERVIVPKTIYPISKAVNDRAYAIRNKYGVDVILKNIYKSTESTNLSLRDVGIIEFKYVRDITRELIVSGIMSWNDFYSPEQYTTDILQFRPRPKRINVPVLKGRATYDYIYLEGVLEAISRMSIEHILSSTILEDNFANAVIIRDKVSSMTGSLWYKWVLGRLDVPKPLRLDLSETCVGQFYSINIDRVLSKGTKTRKLRDSDITHCCYFIETYLLDMISRRLNNNNINILL